jgi:hypothetical protein
MNPFKTRMLVILGAALVLIQSSWAEMPKLPEGGETSWTMAGVHEVVCYTMFDPSEHVSLLPENFRFVTLEEISIGGAQWAQDYLKMHPTHKLWGISFLEIVQSKTFLIDGKAPSWPPDERTEAPVRSLS